MFLKIQIARVILALTTLNTGLKASAECYDSLASAKSDPVVQDFLADQGGAGALRKTWYSSAGTEYKNLEKNLEGSQICVEGKSISVQPNRFMSFKLKSCGKGCVVVAGKQYTTKNPDERSGGTAVAGYAGGTPQR